MKIYEGHNGTKFIEVDRGDNGIAIIDVDVKKTKKYTTSRGGEATITLHAPKLIKLLGVSEEDIKNDRYGVPSKLVASYTTINGAHLAGVSKEESRKKRIQEAMEAIDIDEFICESLAIFLKDLTDRIDYCNLEYETKEIEVYTNEHGWDWTEPELVELTSEIDETTAKLKELKEKRRLAFNKYALISVTESKVNLAPKVLEKIKEIYVSEEGFKNHGISSMMF